MAEQKATTRPSRPTIDAVTDNVPPHTGVIEKGGLTNDPSPTMSGRGDVGSIIHILVDGREVGAAVVKPNGTWSFSLPQALSDGEYRLTVRASNDAGWSVPSTSYGIQVDVTPPSQPKIEAATEGTSPMLSGRAEAYSTVTIYDGTTLLGTTTTNIDGTWAFQLPSGLSNGTHALTVSAMDPAGNTSVRSEGFDVTVGPVAPPVPTTKAMLDDMGRDSGNFNFDRLTNDGTAGRLLNGHLTAALKAGEKVQVSTDGGRTWIDALMKSDGTWVAIDPNAHAGNWTIQTRVVNGDGVAGESTTYDVMLDTKAPDAPGSLTFDSATGVVHVGITGTGAIAGDIVKIIIGNYTVEHALTSSEISAGVVGVTIPKDVQNALGADWSGNARVNAAIVDQSGNSSEWRWAQWEARSLNFDGVKMDLIFVGNSITYDGLKVTKTMHPNGSTSNSSTSGAGISNGYLSFGGGITIDFQGFTAHRFDFDYKNAPVSPTEVMRNPAVMYFFDKNGKSLGSMNLQDFNWTTKTFIAPEGSEIASIKITSMKAGNSFNGYNSFYLDNFVFDKGVNNSNSGAWKTGVDAIHDHQIVVELSDAYHGGAGNDVFNLSDVRYLDKPGAGIHGGAGIDTLELTGANQTLDLSKLLGQGHSDKLSSIEIIDITGTGDNVLKLSMRDVLELGHADVFRTDGHTQMMVNGNAGDRVELSGMTGINDGRWTNQGMVAINGMAYVVYENTALNVELLVQAAVTTSLV
ncbi:Ig-like domain-containing protein [Burkholderia metallica]|uniref:Ig-like domain-containing protein n=1 Tax=Burkholderia metallica TaxID=488729 RepID=UPI001CF4D8FF|nr:Ig-like domain-containing protein [Burkholderia metallica]MCA8003001.1 Ig-like domain-containing protein [Burkholderia metallica]